MILAQMHGTYRLFHSANINPQACNVSRSREVSAVLYIRKILFLFETAISMADEKMAEFLSAPIAPSPTYLLVVTSDSDI